MWAGYGVPGGHEIDAAQGWQIAPTHALIKIPGQDYRRLPRP
ncbi:hypothetical protein [Streptomyces sp. SID3343]|nr:hypothetical protein [Streptomyces sp. SID3343]